MKREDHRTKQKFGSLKFIRLILMMLALGGYSIAQAATPKASFDRAITAPSADTCVHCYYVDSVNGSDSNTGTSRSQAWRTIQKAADTMVPGDATTVIAASPDERVQVSISGTSGAPITYQAEGTVVMQGFTIHANYIQILGFEITDTPDDNQDGWGIFVEGSNCLIENNYVHYATRGGINIWASPGDETKTNQCIVRNNRLYRNSQVGINVNGRDNLIEGNEVWGTIQYHPKWVNPPDWVDADGIRFFGSGHIIRGNFIHDIKFGIPENVDPHIDCFQTFSNTDHELAQNVLIEKNICKNAQAQTTGEIGKGVMLEGANHLLIQNNIIEAFNNVNINGDNNITVVNNVFTSILTLNMSFDTTGISLTDAPNTMVKNNIFYNLPNHIIYVHDDASKQGLDVGYNSVFRSDGKKLWDAPYPHDLWGVNPLFVNPGTDDFHLMSVSPAIDMGTTLADVTTDFDGEPRPQGSGYDIGAYEYAPVANANLNYSTWLPLVISK